MNDIFQLQHLQGHGVFSAIQMGQLLQLCLLVSSRLNIMSSIKDRLAEVDRHKQIRKRLNQLTVSLSPQSCCGCV